MMSNYGLLFFIIGSVMALSIVLKKLTIPAALTGGVLGLCVYAGAGFTGIAMMGAFFILATAATSFKKAWKEKVRLSTRRDAMRNAAQVLANGGMAALLGAGALFFPQKVAAIQVLMAASLAAATADTVSSELGVVFGRRFYNIRTLQKDTRGLDGVVSWEGTFLGIAGSAIIALIYAIGFGLGKAFIIILIAGTIGNIADSFLGATLERTQLLTNNAVNFFNTLIGALAAFLLLTLF